MVLPWATGLDNQPHDGDHRGKKVSLGGTVMVAGGASTRRKRPWMSSRRLVQWQREATTADSGRASAA
jgi:hypothetical protein